MAFERKPPGRGQGGSSGRPSGGKSFGDRKPSGGFGGKKSFGDRAPRGEGGFSDRPKRDFSDRPKRDFGDRPPRGDFADRPPRRDFGDRSPRGEAGFNDRPKRDFGDRPKRDFGDRPQRSYDDRPKRDFGDRPPRRDFGDRPPRGEGGFNDRPKRDFGDRPQRSYDDRPKRDFGDRPPRRDFGDRPPRGEGGFNDRPKRDFGDRPQRSYDDRPKRDFGDRPPRRDFDDRKSYGSDRPKRDFDDRPPTGADRRVMEREDDAARDAEGPMAGHETLLFGVHAVQAAMRNTARVVKKIWATSNGLAHLTDVTDTARHPQPEMVEKRDLERKLPENAVHQGIAVAVEPLTEVFLADVLTAARAENEARHVVVVLDEVTDPHNIGAVLRSMAVFGAKAMIVHKRNAPGITGTMAKIATGALEHIPMIPVVNLGGALEELKAAGFFCLGLDENADYPLGSAPSDGHIALVLGAEGEGLRAKTRELCDAIAAIPTLGPIQSLNVSNAAAISLYALTQMAPADPIATPKPAKAKATTAKTAKPKVKKAAVSE